MNTRLPTYALYGEAGGKPAYGADIGWLHCESIAERSRLHDWEIGVHRHESLFQLLAIRSGSCDTTLDGQRLKLRGPCLVTVPALVVHGFHFSPDVKGIVATVLEQRVQGLLDSDPALKEHVLRPHAQAIARDNAPGIDRAVQALLREYHGHADWRGVALDVTLLHLLVLAGRALTDVARDSEPHGQRALDHVQRFRHAIARRFREQPSMAVCASELGITPTQLNRACQQVLGHNALGVLHARLLLEAQRELAYTTMSVKQIAFGLGFADAAYFTRFFQRHTGGAPSAWRSEARSG
jgi:AraC family transcriptional activator of pobA